MTRVLMQSSTGSTSNSSPTRKANDGMYLHSTLLNQPSTNNPTFHNISPSVAEEDEEEEVGGERKRRRQQQQQQRQQREEEEEDEDEAEREYQFQLNDFVGFFLTAFRKSVLGCSSCEINSSTTSICSSRASCGNSGSGGGAMEIGVPTNVRHVAHVTFDRFNGFLGLPLEFEPHVPTRPPSASTTVFGVSTNSMQLSFDTRGNSVPTILLMMQHRLYALGGLQAEGIFRINPDNGQEESVREQLNRGLLPEDVDVHSLAGLIKAWFRELPTGVLDCLSPEQVMQSQTEQECTELARLLPPTEFALLDWAINLMADVAQFEHLNKMNARNIAMVFAPNMTHMTDPLTALMHAVQVMNFLKTLIEKTLREREDSIIESALDYFNQDPYGGNGHHFSLQTIIEEASEPDAEEERDSTPVNPSALDQDGPSSESFGPGEDQPSTVNCEDDEAVQEEENISLEYKNRRNNSAKLEGVKQSCTPKKAGQKGKERCIVQAGKSNEKAKGRSLVNSMNLRSERIEAWR